MLSACESVSRFGDPFRRGRLEGRLVLGEWSSSSTKSGSGLRSCRLLCMRKSNGSWSSRGVEWTSSPPPGVVATGPGGEWRGEGASLERDLFTHAETSLAVPEVELFRIGHIRHDSRLGLDVERERKSQTLRGDPTSMFPPDVKRFAPDDLGTPRTDPSAQTWRTTDRSHLRRSILSAAWYSGLHAT